MRASKRPLLLGAATAASVAVALVTPQIAGAAPITPKPAGKISKNVIVLLRDQHKTLPSTPTGRTRITTRARALNADQTTVAGRNGVARKADFSSVNGFAATVDATKAATLAHDPAVAAVLPDLPITRPSTPKDRQQSGRVAPHAVLQAGTCPTDPTKPLLEPEALQTMNVAYADGRTAAQSLSTGTGVKVAWLADGIDINNTDFLRADGSHVFTDYQDFTGEGPNAPSSAAEAFGDASSIAAQGRNTYDLSQFVNPVHALPADCNITVRGVAPGASLVGLKVFGAAPTAPTSRFIQALDYAVNTAHVDVINESFGANPYPDTQNDPISLADDAAIRAGVTVVASTGDAGTNGTIGSPATSSGVIAAAATTTYRSYAQTTAEGVQFGKTWADDNISPLSSGGFAQNGKVPDVSAPGDLGWALCSTNVKIYLDCTNYNLDPQTGAGQPSPIQNFGGTSMSSPLTAGVAALVISAFRAAHPGAADPSPSLVKRLITGTAKDLGHLASEQGTGEVDALAAVRAAQSIPAGTTPSTTVSGNALLLDRSQFDLQAATGGTFTGKTLVRNVSASPQTITPTVRSLTKTLSDEHGSFDADLSSTNPATKTFADELARSRGYVTKTFTVPPNANRLDASLAYQVAPGGSLARFFLVDPNGVFQTYSIPQGGANFGHVDVRAPAPGTWTLYFQSGSDPAIAFNGTVSYRFTTSQYAAIGTASPATLTLPAGGTGYVSVRVPASARAGDVSASLQLTSPYLSTSLPLSLRTLVPTAATTSTFSGEITGGNGRGGSGAQSNTYYLDVPAGRAALSIGVDLTNQFAPDETITAYLVDPNGQPLSSTSNVRASAQGNASYQGGLQMYRRSPQAGRWKLVLQVANPVNGVQVSQPFTGTVSFAAQTATLDKPLPNSRRVVLKGGQEYGFVVTVKNTSTVPLTYFADPRLNHNVNYALASQTPGSDLQNLPLPDNGTSPSPTWLVPSNTSTVAVTAAASLPINVDTGWFYGDPEVFGQAVGNTATATLSAPQVAPGPWYAGVGEIGPFAGPAPKGTVSYDAAVTTAAFDPALLTSTGDYWQTAVQAAPATDTAPTRTPGLTKNNHWSRAAQARANETGAQVSAAAAQDVTMGPLNLKPGQSGQILVVVAPSAADKGTITSGRIAIDTLDPYLGTADELLSVPYGYTVG